MPAREALFELDADLHRIFAHRLRSLVTYGAPLHSNHDAHIQTLAVVEGLTGDDLHSCATRVPAWHAASLATPLLLDAQELPQSLDAFPIEFSAILASYVVISGVDPFVGCQLDLQQLRTACELQARSHLLHLREDYLETEGRGSALAELILESAPALAALVTNIARLEGAGADGPDAAAQHVEGVLGLTAGSLARVVTLAGGPGLSSDDARKTWGAYLEGIERLTRYVDKWSPA
ncbi:MAG: hypothetical protein AB7F99_07765 [Vicinamibacterales bacterium]